MNFFFPSRIARLSYLFRSLVFGVATWPLASMFDQKNTVATLNDLWLFLLAVTLIGYWLAYIVRPRCKDVGMRWGWIFLMLVPLVDVGFGLILLFSRSRPALEEKNADPGGTDNDRAAPGRV